MNFEEALALLSSSTKTSKQSQAISLALGFIHEEIKALREEIKGAKPLVYQPRRPQLAPRVPHQKALEPMARELFRLTGAPESRADHCYVGRTDSADFILRKKNGETWHPEFIKMAKQVCSCKPLANGTLLEITFFGQEGEDINEPLPTDDEKNLAPPEEEEEPSF